MTYSDGREVIGWQTVYIFISSTFNDMHAERDYLVKQVFPELRDWCEQRRLLLKDVDLRWGVTEEDATRNRNVVPVCLDRIDRCRPFFVCFVGQRYGWIPRRTDMASEPLQRFPGLAEAVDKGCSVTELEVLHAVISPFHDRGDTGIVDKQKARHAFFYLRDEAYLSDMPDDPEARRRIYTDEAERDYAVRHKLIRKLRDLRLNTIPATGRPLRTYQCKWFSDARTPELAVPLNARSTLKENQDRWRRFWLEQAGVEIAEQDLSVPERFRKRAEQFNDALTAGRLAQFQLGERSLRDVLTEDLKTAISERFPENIAPVYQSELQQEIDQHEQFLHINAEAFIRRTDDYTKLENFLEDDSLHIYVLSGKAGSGKSALLANWVLHRRNQSQDSEGPIVVGRFMGSSDQTADSDSLMRWILRELQEVHYLFFADIPNSPEDLREAWPLLLSQASESKSVAIVIDALDQMQDKEPGLGWLRSPIGERIKFIVSVKEEDELLARLSKMFAKRDDVVLDQMKPFDDVEDRRSLVRAYLNEYLKELDDHLIDAVINSPAGGNPLWLKVVLSELRIFGSFTSLGERIQQAFGVSPEAAFEEVLERLESDPMYSTIELQSVVPLIMGFLAHARHGLSVMELSGLIQHRLGVTGPLESDVRDTVEVIFRQLRPFLARREGRYDFFYDSFRSAALRRYVADTPDTGMGRQTKKAWHHLLADFFQRNANPDPQQPWRDASRRSLVELPHHLLHAEDYETLSRLYLDFAYLEQVCLISESRPHNEEDRRHAGIHLLLSGLREAETYSSSGGEQPPSAFLEQIRAIYSVLVERAGLLREYPTAVSQEIINWLPAILPKESMRSVRSNMSTPTKRGMFVSRRVSCESGTAGHSAAITAMSAARLKNDQDRLLTGSADGKIGYWQLGASSPSWVVHAHSGAVRWVSLSSNGQALTCGEEGKVFLWETETCQRRLVKHVGQHVSLVEFLSDGSAVLISQGAVIKCDPDSGKEVWRQSYSVSPPFDHRGDLLDFAVEKDMLAMSDGSTFIVVMNCFTEEVVATIEVNFHVDHLALSSDACVVLVTDRQGRVLCFDLVSERIHESDGAEPVRALCRMSHDTAFLGFSGGLEPALTEFKIHNGIRVSRQECPGAMQLLDSRPSHMVMFQDNMTVALGEETGGITLMDTRAGRLYRRWDPAVNLCLGTLLPKGKGATALQGTHRLGRSRTGRMVVHISQEGKTNHVYRNPHSRAISGIAHVGGQRTVTVDQGGRTVAWNRDKVVKVLDIDKKDIRTCAKSPVPRMAVAGTWTDEIVFVGLGGGAVTRGLRGNDESGSRPGISALAAAGRPMRIAAGYFNGNVRLVEFHSFEMSSEGRIECPGSGRITTVAMSPQGALAASGSATGEVHLWSWDKNGAKLHWHLHDGEVTALSFSRNGEELYSGGVDRCLYRLSITSGEVRCVTMLPGVGIDIRVDEDGRIVLLDSNGSVFWLTANAPEEMRGGWKWLRTWLRGP